MSTIISLQTILWSASAGIGLPVLVFLVWKFKFCRGAKLFPAVVGAVTFVVFAQVLEGVPKAIFFGGGTGVSQYVLTHAWAYTLIGCLLAGVFEEVGRYLAFRFLLKRYTKEVYLTYDSDGAGIKAALRAIPILKEVGITTKIINMKPYKDPDEFIKALGAQEYEERIKKAENSFMFQIRIMQAGYDMDDPESKTAFYNEIAKKLLGFTEELERTNYTQAVSREYSIPYDDLRKLVNSMAMKGGIVKPQTKLKSGINEKNKKEDGMKQSQKLLLTWLIEDNSLFDRIKGRISADDFTEELYHKVAKEVFSQYETTHTVNPARIVSMFTDEDEQREVAGLFNATIHQVEGKNDKATALRETVVRIKQNSIDYRSKHLAPTDMEGMMRIIEDKRALEELQKIPE